MSRHIRYYVHLLPATQLQQNFISRTRATNTYWILHAQASNHLRISPEIVQKAPPKNKHNGGENTK